MLQQSDHLRQTRLLDSRRTILVEKEDVRHSAASRCSAAGVSGSGSVGAKSRRKSAIYAAICSLEFADAMFASAVASARWRCRLGGSVFGNFTTASSALFWPGAYAGTTSMASAKI
jgi:hypothetical protein